MLIGSAAFSPTLLKSPGQSAWVGSGPAGCSQCCSFESSANSKYSHVADLLLQILGGHSGLDASLYRHTEPTQVQCCVPPEKSWSTGLCNADRPSWWLYAVALFIWQCQCQGRAHKSSWTWDYCVNSLLGASVLRSGVCPVISLLSWAFWLVPCPRQRWVLSNILVTLWTTSISTNSKWKLWSRSEREIFHNVCIIN